MRLIVTNKPMSPRIIVKEKAAVFIIATVVLLLNLFLLLARIFSFLGFLLVLLIIFVGANAAFRLIDRRRQSKQGT
jgi:predicted membrane protein